MTLEQVKQKYSCDSVVKNKIDTKPNLETVKKIKYRLEGFMKEMDFFEKELNKGQLSDGNSSRLSILAKRLLQVR